MPIYTIHNSIPILSGKAEYAAGKPGVYEFIVYGYDPNTSNTGVDRVSFVVGE